MPAEAIEAMLRNIAVCDEAMAAQKDTVALFSARGFTDLAEKARATMGIMEQVQRDNYRALADLKAKTDPNTP